MYLHYVLILLIVYWFAARWAMRFFSRRGYRHATTIFWVVTFLIFGADHLMGRVVFEIYTRTAGGVWPITITDDAIASQTHETNAWNPEKLREIFDSKDKVRLYQLDAFKRVTDKGYRVSELIFFKEGLGEGDEQPHVFRFSLVASPDNRCHQYEDLLARDQSRRQWIQENLKKHGISDPTAVCVAVEEDEQIKSRYVLESKSTDLRSIGLQLRRYIVRSFPERSLVTEKREAEFFGGWLYRIAFNKWPADVWPGVSRFVVVPTKMWEDMVFRPNPRRITTN